MSAVPAMPVAEPRAVPPQSARGCARLAIKRGPAGASGPARLFQQGCLKLRRQGARAGPAHYALINTAGGLTGGDRLDIEVAVEEGAEAVVTTPACEKVYRAAGGEARVAQRLRLAARARLAWLPQETILFEGGRLRRELSIDMAASARLVLADAVLFGRAAMGERVRRGLWHDDWRLRVEGDLVFAERARLGDPPDAALADPACLAGQAGMAVLVRAGEGAEALLDPLRAAIDGLEGAIAGASLVGPVLVCRMAAPSGAGLRAGLLAALGALREGAPAPRNWFC